MFIYLVDFNHNYLFDKLLTLYLYTRIRGMDSVQTNYLSDSGDQTGMGAVNAALLNNCAEAIILLDESGMVKYQNPSVNKVSGYTAEETYGRSVFDFVCAEDLAASVDLFVATTQTPAVQTPFQFRAIHKEGHLFWIEGTLTNLLLDPVVKGFIISYRDITGRKQTEHKLEQSSNELNKLFKTIHEVLFTVDSKRYKVTQMSPACITLFGYTPEEFMTIDDLWQNVIHPDDKGFIPDQFAKLAQGITVRNEYRIIHKNGSIRWVQSTVIPELDAQGVLDRIDGITIDITVRKEAEISLHENIELTKQLVESSPEAIIVRDNVTGCFVDCNENAVKRFGYSREELLKKKPWDLCPEFQPDGVISADRQRHYGERSTTGERVVYELVHLHASGALLYSEVRITQLELPGRDLARVSIIDIEEKKKAEERLKENILMFREFFESAPEAIVVRDNDNHTFIDCNEIALERFGYDRHTFLNKQPWDLCPKYQPDGRLSSEVQSTNIAKALAGEKMIYELVHIDSQGRELYSEVRLNRLNIPGRNITRTSIIDIADKKRAEAAILKSRANLNAIVNNADTAYILMDDKQTVVTFNEVAERMAGFAFGTKLIQGNNFLNSLPENKQQQFMVHLEKVQAGEKIVYEISYPDPKGGEIWLYVRIYGIRDEQNNIFGLCIAASDISRRKKAEKEITELNQSLEEKIKLRTAELEQANHELESFSYTVSHDLQTPLRILRGFSDVLLEEHGDQLDESGRESLEIISKNAELMSQLIKELLDFAHIGKTSLIKRNVSMDEVCSIVIQEARKLDPSIKADIDLLPMGNAYCDPTLIRQVWSNLVQNAIKYSRKKPQAVIKIGRAEVNGKQAYYIKDNGAGFDMKYARKLFGVFKRLHSSDEFEGTGVGLAVVHRIITRHGGEIWADAKVDEGAIFYFTLPDLSPDLS